MIVNYTEEGWSMITQRAHGLLAAQICGQWKKDMQPQRWVETLIATAEHDDVLNEFSQAELIYADGGPKNFKMTEFRRDECDRLLMRALAKGRYVGILTSMHMRFLYAEMPAAKTYCKSLEKNEKAWIKALDTSLTQVKCSYELLEFCDALSLIICQQTVQPENRTMEISNGPDGTAYQLSTSESGSLIVTPWPFETKLFQVTYESRSIRQIAFKSDDAFRRKLRSADVTEHRLTIAMN